MLQGTYTAAMGITAQQKRIDTIANNIANISTNGFKASRANFKDALYQTMQRPVQPQGDLNLEKGHGTLVSGYTRLFSQGQMMDGDDTSAYIVGDGFFTMQDARGNTFYTRDGEFARSQGVDGNWYLTDASNSYRVMDRNGQPIRLPEGAISIGADGSISSEAGGQIATMNIVDFPNRQGLEAAGDNMYVVSASSGQARQATDFTVRGGSYEGSNVDMATELTALIRGQRRYRCHQGRFPQQTGWMRRQ